MSNISDRHLIQEFVSGKSKPLSDQRLAVVSYKLTKADKDAGLKEKSKMSVCASVPKIQDAELTDAVMAAFKPYVMQLIEDTQDKIVREFNDVGQSSVGTDDISIANVLVYLDEDSKGARLTKETIKEWFNASVQDVLAVAFAEKMGIPETPNDMQVKQLEQQLNVYRESFAQLAGGKTSFAPEKATKLQKVLELCADDDVMAARFNVRLEKMKIVIEADMLGL